VSRRAPRPLSFALDGLTGALAPATVLARVQGIWPAAAGPEIAAAATPTAARAGVLTVSCEAAVWAQELDLMAVTVLERVNSALGEEAISELRCVTV
jgi:predicted nucleic acid-binding Zn ribbon protein